MTDNTDALDYLLTLTAMIGILFGILVAFVSEVAGAAMIVIGCYALLAYIVKEHRCSSALEGC